MTLQATNKCYKLKIVSDNLDRTIRLINALITSRTLLYDRIPRTEGSAMDVEVFAPRGSFDRSWKINGDKIHLRLTSTVGEECGDFEELVLKYKDTNLAHPTAIVTYLLDDFINDYKNGNGCEVILLLAFFERFELLYNFLDRFFKMYLSLDRRIREFIKNKIKIFITRSTHLLSPILEEMNKEFAGRIFDIHLMLDIALDRILYYMPFKCGRKSRDRVIIYACLPNDTCSVLDFIFKTVNVVEESYKKKAMAAKRVASDIKERIKELKRCGEKLVRLNAHPCERVQLCKITRHLVQLASIPSGQHKAEEDVIRLNVEVLHFKIPPSQGSTYDVKTSKPPSAVCSPLSEHVYWWVKLKEVEERPARWISACIESERAKTFFNALRPALPETFLNDLGGDEVRIYSISAFPCNLQRCLREARCEGGHLGSESRVFLTLVLDVGNVTMTDKASGLRIMVAKGRVRERGLVKVAEDNGYAYYVQEKVPFYCDNRNCPLVNNPGVPRGLDELASPSVFIERDKDIPYISVDEFEKCLFGKTIDDAFSRFIHYNKLMRDVNLNRVRDHVVRCMLKLLEEEFNPTMIVKVKYYNRQGGTTVYCLLDMNDVIKKLSLSLGLETSEVKWYFALIYFEFFLRGIMGYFEKMDREKNPRISRREIKIALESRFRYLLKDFMPILF